MRVRVLGQVGQQERAQAAALERIGDGERHLGRGRPGLARVLGVPDDPLRRPGQHHQPVVLRPSARGHGARGAVEVDGPEEPIAPRIRGERPQERGERVHVAGADRPHAHG